MGFLDRLMDRLTKRGTSWSRQGTPRLTRSQRLARMSSPRSFRPTTEARHRPCFRRPTPGAVRLDVILNLGRAPRELRRALRRQRVPVSGAASRSFGARNPRPLRSARRQVRGTNRALFGISGPRKGLVEPCARHDSNVRPLPPQGPAVTGGAGSPREPPTSSGDAPGTIRTCDLCLRRAALYPLSYGRVPGSLPAPVRRERRA